MKNFIQFLFAFTILNCFFATIGNAQGTDSFKVGNLVFERIGNSHYVALKGGNPIDSLIVPNSVTYDNNNYIVKCISEKAFYDNFSIKYVFIPDSIEEIDSAAFRSCQNVETISIGKSVKNIGDYAFYDTHIDTIYVHAIIPPKVGYASLDDRTTNLGVLFVPDGYTSVYSQTYPWEAFQKIYNLSDSEVITSQRNTFVENSVTYEIIDGESVRILKEPNVSIFHSPISIKYNNVLYVIKEIANEAFSNNRILKEVYLSDSINTIGKFAFRSSQSLERVSLGKNISKIGSYAFYDTNIKEIKLQSSNPPIVGEATFDSDIYNSALLYVPNNSKQNYEQAYPWSLFLNIKELSPTSINNIIRIKKNNINYNLNGVKTKYPKRGIFITNGIKYILKDK